MISLRSVVGLSQHITKTILFQSKYSCYTINPRFEHYTQLLMRNHRRKYLDQIALKRNRKVLHAEIRTPKDGVLELKKQGKCPAVIHQLSGKDQIDVVLDGATIRSMSKYLSFGTDTVYVHAGGQQYRCILKKVHYHGLRQFIKLAQLYVYEPGQPNQLVVPIEISHLTENPYTRLGANFQLFQKQVKILCYNDDYPKKFTVDMSYVNPLRFYRVADLANTFPPGILLHKQQNPQCRIVMVGKSPNEKAQKANQQRIQEMKERAAAKKKAAKEKQAGK